MTHLVEVEEEDGDLIVVRFVCEAAPDAVCRSWCVEGTCEEVCVARTVYVSAEPIEVAQAPVDGHRFVPLDPPTCRVVDYLGMGDAHDRAELHADEDEPLRPGRHPIVEEWDGDCYLWTYAEPEALVTDAGVPL